jgi:hypothetical protein
MICVKSSGFSWRMIWIKAGRRIWAPTSLAIDRGSPKMSEGDMAFVSAVVVAMATFAIVLFSVTWTTNNRPRK